MLKSVAYVVNVMFLSAKEQDTECLKIGGIIIFRRLQYEDSYLVFLVGLHNFMPIN